MLVKIATLLPPSRIMPGSNPNFIPDSLEAQQQNGSYGAIAARLKRPSSVSILGVTTPIHYVW